MKVDDEDLVPENLDSINRLVAFVERKKVLAVVGAEHAVPCSVGAGSPGLN